MDKEFKNNNTDQNHNDNDSYREDTSVTSDIDKETTIIDTPLNAHIKTSSSWPNSPFLTMTSDHGHEISRTPSESSMSTQLQHSSKLDLPFNNQKEELVYSINDQSFLNDDDDADSFGTLSKVTSLHNDHHKVDQVNLEDSATTLIEAALDKDEAKDRHIRFQEHVAESATLVQRMLSVKSTQQRETNEDPIGQFMQKRYEARNHEDIETYSSYPTINNGGSILASLMKLETHRSAVEKKQRSKKHLHLKRKKQKTNSLYELPFQSTPDLLVSDSDFSTLRPQRPALVNRPSSWFSEIASSKYVVPSLEKRKKSAMSSFSRRSSIDSMVTTASQFEPITLEDRIRITFEIANILQKQEFLRKLCRSLMLYGCPAHRIEHTMRQVSHTLGVEAEYIFLPNIMLITFIDSTTHTTETHFIRQNQIFEMHRLADIYRLEKLVSHGEISVDEALDFIDKVYDQPPIYPIWLQPFSYALASFSGCILFYGGRWREGGVAAALSMVFATNEIFSAFIASFQPIWEITVCILIGFVARGIQKYGFCFTPIGFSSFIIVLPGYPMTVGIIELVSRQVVSGVVRMVYAIIYSYLLGYGVSMGSELYMTIDKSATADQTEECKLASNAGTCIASEPQIYNILLVPLFAVAYCVFLRARPPRWPIMISVSIWTYLLNYALACWAHAPTQTLQVASAFGLGLVGNLLSKFTGKMSFDAVLLGVFYLVPSALGIRAAYGLFSGTDEVQEQGANLALAMIESSIGISLGLFLSTLLVYPKGTQHTPLMNL